MSLARWLWGSEVDASRIPAAFLLAVYGVNLLFAVVLTASVGLWGPTALALSAVLLPALAVSWRVRRAALALDRPRADVQPVQS